MMTTRKISIEYTEEMGRKRKYVTAKKSLNVEKNNKARNYKMNRKQLTK